MAHTVSHTVSHYVEPDLISGAADKYNKYLPAFLPSSLDIGTTGQFEHLLSQVWKELLLALGSGEK